jgi:hypothetical protein
MMLLNDFSQAVRERILYNATALGELKDVLDRDEEPEVLANNPARLPICCVIPIGEGQMTSQEYMGSSDQENTWQQHVVIWGRFSKDNKSPYSDIDIMRGYGKTLKSLFSQNVPFSLTIPSDQQTGRVFNGCVVTKWTLKYTPRQQFDFMLDRILLTMSVKCVET